MTKSISKHPLRYKHKPKTGSKQYISLEKAYSRLLRPFITKLTQETTSSHVKFKSKHVSYFVGYLDDFLYELVKHKKNLTKKMHSDLMQARTWANIIYPYGSLYNYNRYIYHNLHGQHNIRYSTTKVVYMDQELFLMPNDCYNEKAFEEIWYYLVYGQLTTD